MQANTKDISLSFSKGRAIARIEGGIHNGKIIHIYDPLHKCCAKCTEKCKKNKRKCCKNCSQASNHSCGGDDEYTKSIDPIDLLTEKFIREQKKHMNVIDLEKIKRALKKTDPEYLTEDLVNIYENSKKLLDHKLNTEILLHDGKIIPLPNKDKIQGSRFYIAAPSGAGKSTFAASLIKEHKKMFPNDDLVVFSNEEKDEAIDELSPIRIKIDENMIDEPIEKEELEDSIVLFDDIDAMNDKKLEKAVGNLRDNLLKEGRKHGIYVICTAHQLTDYKKTRNVLNDCDSIVFFPKSNVAPIKYYLKNYAGLSVRQIDEIISLPSRWVMYFKNYPGAIVYDSGVYLLTKKDKPIKKRKNKVKSDKEEEVESESEKITSEEKPKKKKDNRSKGYRKLYNVKSDNDSDNDE